MFFFFFKKELKLPNHNIACISCPGYIYIWRAWEACKFVPKGLQDKLLKSPALRIWNRFFFRQVFTNIYVQQISNLYTVRVHIKCVMSSVTDRCKSRCWYYGAGFAWLLRAFLVELGLSVRTRHAFQNKTKSCMTTGQALPVRQGMARMAAQGRACEAGLPSRPVLQEKTYKAWKGLGLRWGVV